MRNLPPILVFLVFAALGLAGAAAVYIASGRIERVRFAAEVDEAVGRIDARMRQHIILLEASAAYLEADGPDLTADRFRSFVDNLALDWQHPGLLGLGFAPLIPAEGATDLVLAEGKGPIRPWPATDQAWRAPMVLIEPADAPVAALGYDLQSDPALRTAMTRAADSEGRAASAPVRLAGNDEERPSFVLFTPLETSVAGLGGEPGSERPAGFAFALLRIADLFRTTVELPPALPLHVSAREADAPESAPVFVSSTPPATGRGSGLRASRQIDIGGRDWVLQFRPTEAFARSAGQLVAVLLGALSLLSAAALAASLQAQARQAATSAALADATRRNLAEKELLLREMQHRIKNSITRILAMARQTAARASDLDAFSSSFTERLQAMASAQDMLTRSSRAGVALQALVTEELAQVFGRALAPDAVSGPEIRLNEAGAQALGLTFHELATNALKYGGGPEAGGDICIAWRIEGDGRLAIEWLESGGAELSGPPGETGFGTKLIDASIRMELGGTVERDWRPTGLAVRFVLPLDRIAAAGGKQDGHGSGS